MSKAISHLIEFYVLNALLVSLRLLPRMFVLSFARFLGRMVWYAGVRRKIVLENLETCFPDWTPAKRLKVGRKSSEQFIMNLADYLYFATREGRGLNDHVRFIQPHAVFKNAIAEGRGAILISGHLGSWEANAAIEALNGISIHVIAQKLRNPLLDGAIRSLRESWGFNPIPKGIAARETFRMLRAKEVVGVLIDQDAGRHGIFVPFFGELASTLPTVGAYAEKTNAPIVGTHALLQPDGTYHVYHERIVYEEDLDADDVIYAVTERINIWLTEQIRRNPEHYFWFHRRFKTKLPQN